MLGAVAMVSTKVPKAMPASMRDTRHSAVKLAGFTSPRMAVTTTAASSPEAHAARAAVRSSSGASSGSDAILLNGRGAGAGTMS